MTRAVEWLVAGRLVTVLLTGAEVTWYQVVAGRVAKLEPGPERSAAVNELRAILDLKAICGGSFAPALPDAVAA